MEVRICHSKVCSDTVCMSVCRVNVRRSRMKNNNVKKQENVCMEALAEFMSRKSSDVNNFSAVKQDKPAELQETVMHVKALVGQGLCLSDSAYFAADDDAVTALNWPFFSNFPCLNVQISSECWQFYLWDNVWQYVNEQSVVLDAVPCHLFLGEIVISQSQFVHAVSSRWQFIPTIYVCFSSDELWAIIQALSDT